jgi:hypothetical protein
VGVEKGVGTGTYVEVSYDDISRAVLSLENKIKRVAVPYSILAPQAL